MFIVARTKPERIAEIERYLYAGQSIVSEPVSTVFGDMVVIESAHGPVGNMLADRLASGLIGAVRFETRAEADAYVADEVACSEGQA